MDDNFNSSDVELELPVRTKRHTIKSIDKIIEASGEDRLKTKAAVKSIEFGHGAPGTRYEQDLWVTRFNTFREFTLRQSLATPFTGDDVIRYMDAQIDKLKRIQGLPPCEENVETALAVISAYGTFTYAAGTGYKLTPNDAARLKSWKAKALQDNRLFRGRKNKIIRLTFVVSSRLVQEYLAHFRKCGTSSWSRTIARALSIVLVVACASRAGDITRSQLYKALEYTKYRDMVITLGEGDSLLDLQAVLTLTHVKEYKDKVNMDRVLYFSTMRNPKYLHMCPILMLLTHALRHGLVRGSSIEEVLQHTVNSRSRTVEWLFPERPVLAAFQRGTGVQIKLDHPAPINQLLDTTKSMGLISNLLVPRVTTHNFRHGAAKDLQHISAVPLGMGQHVRQALGHSRQTEMRGATDYYAGDIEIDLLSVRAEKEFISRAGPKFSTESALGVVNAPISVEELQKYFDEHEPGKAIVLDENAKARARRAIRRVRLESFCSTAPMESAPKASAAPAVLQQKTRSEANTPSYSRDTKKTPNKTSFQAPKKSVGAKDHIVNKSPLDFEVETPKTLAIDPRLLELDANQPIQQVENIDVDPQSIEDLQDDMIPCSGESYTNDEVIAIQSSLIITDLDDIESTSLVDSALALVHELSQINVVCNTNFANIVSNSFFGELPIDPKYERLLARGNSLDAPTLFVHTCTKTDGCNYSRISRKAVAQHEENCEGGGYTAKLAKKTVPCTFEGCDKAFTEERTMKEHLKSHTKPGLPCPECPDDEKTYTPKSLESHKRVHHSGTYPTICLVEPGCSDGQEFTIHAYPKHLKKVHGLTTGEERKPFMPINPLGQAKLRFERGVCGIDGCQVTPPKPGKLKKHVMGQHAKTEAEADAIVKSRYTSLASRKRKLEVLNESDDDE